MVVLFIFQISGQQTRAQQYPSRQITFVVAFAPGGVADTLARLIGKGVGERLQQTVVVENRGGAGGNIAAEVVAHANPDGYTLLATTTALAINQTLFVNKPFLASDFQTVAIAASSPEALVTSPTNPADDLPSFIKAIPGRTINLAIPGVGTGSHVVAEYFFKELAKMPVQPIPYQGGAPAINATIAGQVDLMATTLGGGAAAQINGGKLKGLAIAPSKTDLAIIRKLNATVEEVINDPAIQKTLQTIGFDTIHQSHAEANTYFKSEVAKWGGMVKELGLAIY
jgi:tripartite-type tricarboxylate transporter receptor subunit TctC